MTAHRVIMRTGPIWHVRDAYDPRVVHLPHDDEVLPPADDRNTSPHPEFVIARPPSIA